jgi:enoyl-CoA hydratase
MSQPDLSSNTILIEQRGPILILTINRLEMRNAIDDPTATALATAFRAFNTDDARSDSLSSSEQW